MTHGCHWFIMTLFYVMGLKFGVTFHYIISTHETTTQNKSEKLDINLITFPIPFLCFLPCKVTTISNSAPSATFFPL